MSITPGEKYVPEVVSPSEDSLRRIKNLIAWVTRVTTGLSAAETLDDLHSIIMAAIISPTGLAYSRAILFLCDEKGEVLRGRHALVHESHQAMIDLAHDMESDDAYLSGKNRAGESTSPRMLESELDSLQAATPWIVLFQRLNDDAEFTNKIRQIMLPMRRAGNDDAILLEEAVAWKHPRCVKKSLAVKKMPAELLALLPEHFCIIPLRTNKGLRALLFVDRHLDGDRVATEEEVHQLDWFMRQSSLTLENLEARLDLANAYQELKQLDQLKSNFLSIISHELRTPLTSMNGFMDLILEERVGPINENQRQLLTRVMKNAGHLIHLVNDLIEVAEIEAEGTVEVTIEPVEPLTVLLNTIPRLEQRRRDNDVTIEPRVDGHIPRILSDERALERIFFHLLDNAVKFSPRGGVVTVHFHVTDGLLFIDFCDTGTGIAKENLDHIFKQFYQVDNSLTRGHEGLGLGLAVTKMLINATHGQIDVKSRLQEGSTFSVLYPVYIERDDDLY